MLDKRTAGVLLHISSLPSPFGTGVLGAECRAFINRIKEAQFGWWQILPLNITDAEHSPYCSISAFAGNYIFIDPREVDHADETDVLANISGGSPYTADYEFAEKKRLACLRSAFSHADKALEKELVQFAQENTWVRDFALFMAVKEKAAGRPWWEWTEEYRDYSRCLKHREEFTEEMNFWIYTQYVFEKQYQEIKSYANENGIGVIGDMPFYVSLDSADVWSHTQLFQLDEKTRLPKAVAGVPPDYFSVDGQLWGNPLYDWEQMKKDGYRWWKERMRRSLGLFDLLRIDHFRAFASYWAVPGTAETAKEGSWLNGPGMDFWNEMKREFPVLPIIAEDLGLFGDDVVQLLKDTGFPGMKVIQFGFAPGDDSSHLPHNYEKNCVAYAGTHDNNTLLGWLWDASPEEREFALRYCSFSGDNWGEGGYHSPSCRSIIETLWKSSANTVIIALQDMCGFGKDARMNIPGIPKENWRYRASTEVLEDVDMEYFQHINRIYRRTYPIFDKK